MPLIQRQERWAKDTDELVCNATCACGRPVATGRMCRACGMSQADRDRWDRLGSLVTVGSIVEPFDRDGSIRRQLLADYQENERRIAR